MKFTTLMRASIIAVGAAALALPVAAATLSTPLTGGNNNSGIMFDIVVGASAPQLTSIAVDVTGGTSNYQFYTITGGIGANTGNAGAWTLRDTFTGITGTNGSSLVGNGTLQLLDITDLALAANTTYGLYVTATPGSGVFTRYTNLALGSTVASNGDLSIMSGYGQGALFGNTNNGRAFNGTLTYTGGAVPEPASWALMIGGFGLVGASMRRRRASFTTA